MKNRCYAIKDRRSGFTAPIPFTQVSPKECDELAKRWFENECRENSLMKNFPEDFELHYLGDFDTDTGIFANITGETLLEKGANING